MTPRDPAFPDDPVERPRRSRLRSWGALLLGTVAALVLAEVAIRVKDLVAGYPVRLRATGGMEGAAIPDPHTQMRWRPGYRVEPYRHFPRQWSTNAQGFRGGGDVAAPKPAGTYRVLCLGGSTTACGDVSKDEAAWPARLGALWNESGAPIGFERVEVVNAAVSGWTSLESAIFFQTEGIALAPDVVLMMHVVNDVRAGWCVGLKPDYRPWAGVWVRPCDRPTRLDGVLGWSRLYLVLRDAAWRANTLPGTEPLFWSTDPARPGAWRKDGIHPEAPRYFQNNLEHFVWIARGRAAKPVLLTMPCTLLAGDDALRSAFGSPSVAAPADAYAREHDRYNGIVREVAASTGAGLADMASSMPMRREMFDDCVHLNDEGCDAFARALLDILVPPPPPPPPPPNGR